MEDGGESALSSETSTSCAANALPTVVSPSAELYAISYRVYMGNTTNGGSGSEMLQAELPIGVNFTLPTAGLISVLSAAPMPQTSVVDGHATLVLFQGAGTYTVTVPT